MSIKLFPLIAILVLSASALAATMSEDAIKAQDALDQSLKYINEMADANFSVNKVNDTYLLAEQEFDSKLSLEQRLAAEPDYGSVLTRTDEIKSSRDKAFAAYDELMALGLYLEPYEDMNLTETFKLYDMAKSEFYDERYDESMRYISQAYDKVLEEEAAQSALRVVFENTRMTFLNFFARYWKHMIIGIILSIAISALTFNKALAYLIRRKIKHLEIEREVLRSLIKQAQLAYFEKGRLSEADYHIKVSKFGEMIRDIERQIPLLQEHLAKIGELREEKPKKKEFHLY